MDYTIASGRSQLATIFDMLFEEKGIVRRNEAAYSCPFCGAPQRRRKLTANIEKGVWRCFRCDERGNVYTLARKLGKAIPHDVNLLIADDMPVKGIEGPELDADVLDAVYRELLEQFSLEPHHYESLSKRGMCDEEIQKGGYRSLPRRGRTEAAQAVLERFGPDVLSRVPGFFYRQWNFGFHWMIAGPTGMLIPVRDQKGRIVGIRIRLDKPKIDGPKYVWMSSGGKKYGTPAKVLAHWTKEPEPGSTFWITEGEIKANMAAHRLGVGFVSVPGVNTWERTGVVEQLKQAGVQRVVIAYDMDSLSNARVAKPAHQLAMAILTAGMELQMAVWDPEQGKGIDDLLATGGKPRLATLEEWEKLIGRNTKRKLFPSHRGSYRLPAEKMPVAPEEGPFFTLEEARWNLAQDMRRILSNPRQPGFHVFPSQPGVGKTTAVLNALREMLHDGKWPTVVKREWDEQNQCFVSLGKDARVAFLFASKSAMYEALTVMGDDAEHVAVREGRNGNPDSPYYCDRIDEAKKIGEHRFNVASELCRTCVEEHGEGWVCPFLQTVEASRRSRIVFATHQAMLNLSDELEQFDVIIIDESFVDELVEKQYVDRDRITVWRDGCHLIEDKHGQAYAEAVLQILDDTLDYAARYFSPGERRPAGAIAGISMSTVLKGFFDHVSTVNGKYPFEEIRTVKNTYGKMEKVVPLRFAEDMLRTLDHEIPWKEGRDTRIWVEKTSGGAVRFLCYLPMDHITNALRRRTVIHLDATPHPMLDILFPKHSVHHYPVKENIEVVQVSNSLYTTSYLRDNEQARKRVQEAIDRISMTAERPVIFTSKELSPENEGNNSKAFKKKNDKQRWGWFGAHTRSLNGYMDTDALIFVGHYQHPPQEVEAMVQALRHGMTKKESEAVTKMRVYNWRDADGSGRARNVPVHPDKDVQRVIEWSTESEIIQAIGRGRAVSRKEPLRVYLLTGAVTNLKIDHLTDINTLAGRRCVINPRLAFLNKDRRENAIQKIMNAYYRLRRAGKEMTNRAIAKEAGVSRNTVRALRVVLPIHV